MSQHQNYSMTEEMEGWQSAGKTFTDTRRGSPHPCASTWEAEVGQSGLQPTLPTKLVPGKPGILKSPLKIHEEFPQLNEEFSHSKGSGCVQRNK